MQAFTIDTNTWAEEQFGACDFGDERRTKRGIRLAAQMAAHPDGSIPDQTESGADAKAAYRFFSMEEVTFTALVTPHWEQTKMNLSPGRYLVISDTTEIDFGIHRQVPDMAKTGNGGGYGFLLHSALVVDPETDEVHGLAGQEVHYRQDAPKGESETERLARDRESRIWGVVIDAVGPPPTAVEYVHVCDRGADNIEVFLHLQENESDWVIRVSYLNRNLLNEEGEKMSVRTFVDGLESAGTYELDLRARPERPARKATIAVAFGKIQMPAPHTRSPYVRKHYQGPIAMYVVYVREVDPPEGVEPLEWVLYTSLAVLTFDDAWMIISYYEKRWIIEEWHKALKTGCRVTDRQLKTKDRLEALTGLLCVVAVRLLQLRSVARAEPDRPALDVVPENWVRLLTSLRRLRVTAQAMTVGKFYRELAKLGGFLGRRGDGEPGWITIWRGWEKLHLMIRGYEAATAMNG